MNFNVCQLLCGYMHDIVHQGAELNYVFTGFQTLLMARYKYTCFISGKHL